jgi:hypothetical protein
MLGPMAAQAQNGVSERRCLDGRPNRSIIEKERERDFTGVLGRCPWDGFFYFCQKILDCESLLKTLGDALVKFFFDKYT